MAGNGIGSIQVSWILPIVVLAVMSFPTAALSVVALRTMTRALLFVCLVATLVCAVMSIIVAIVVFSHASWALGALWVIVSCAFACPSGHVVSRGMSRFLWIRCVQYTHCAVDTQHMREGAG